MRADPALRMLAPTTQDFLKAFGLGKSDTTIATGNEEGVALAAIQAPNAKLDKITASLRAKLAGRAAHGRTRNDRRRSQFDPDL